MKRPAGSREPDIDTRTRNTLLRSLRYQGERGFALLTQRWQTLQHVTASPGKIGQIARAVLVLVLFERSDITVLVILASPRQYFRIYSLFKIFDIHEKNPPPLFWGY